MNTIEKFYSDAMKLAKKPSDDFTNEMTRLFCRTVSLHDKRLIELGNDFADYWERLYTEGKLSKEESVEWLYNMLSFLNDEFEDDMDFAQEDWEQINMIVSASAGELDMDILNMLMMIIVDRKKI